LYECGMTKEEIHTLIVENPRGLVEG
jgi:predicted metal-dependent phosphotriesterase family hydrolase